VEEGEYVISEHIPQNPDPRPYHFEEYVLALNMKEGVKGKNVFVGLSGGVDSSVSAALLKEAGAHVTGVFIKVWAPDFIECSWKEEREDAMNVAATLEIPFKEYDFEEEYKKNVVDYMVREYQAGRTPNPDVMCNKYVKFDAFLRRALNEGADYIATGHYARTQQTTDNRQSTTRLLAGKDEAKDQSYFLWTLTQEALEHTLFPVGELEKREVRKRAEQFGLPTARKKDSQGLCFVGHIDIPDFLSHFMTLEKGILFNQEGKEIGYHEGSELYTIGQRHGFVVTDKTPDDEPYFVVAKDVENNTVTVAKESYAHDLLTSRSSFVLEGENWIEEWREGVEYEARIRYRAPLARAVLTKEGNQTRISFLDAPIAPALGQSVVVYQGDVVVGGGILAS
jgi:tRNA-specific 2-thiouridylase